MIEKSKRPTRWVLPGMFGLLALATCLRVYQLDAGLWYDEIVTLLRYVRPPLLDTVTQFPGDNNHPLYSVLAHGAVWILGEHPWTVRLPAMLFGLASIPMCYALGTAVTNRWEAWLAAVILTVSYHHVWFSQDARGYTALLFWALACTYWLIAWWQRRDHRYLWAYAIAAGLGAYTHLSMVFIVVSHAIVCLGFILIDRTLKDRWSVMRVTAATFVGSAILTLALYAPMLADMKNFIETQIPKKNEATMAWAFMEAIRGLQIGWGTSWVVGCAACIFLAGVVSYYRRARFALYLFLIPAPVVVLSGILLDHPLRPRFLFFQFGFVVLIVVRGAAAIGGWVADWLRRDSGSRRRVELLAATALTLGGVAFSLGTLPRGYAGPSKTIRPPSTMSQPMPTLRIG